MPRRHIGQLTEDGVSTFLVKRQGRENTKRLRSINNLAYKCLHFPVIKSYLGLFRLARCFRGVNKQKKLILEEVDGKVIAPSHTPSALGRGDDAALLRSGGGGSFAMTYTEMRCGVCPVPFYETELPESRITTFDRVTRGAPGIDPAGHAENLLIICLDENIAPLLAAISRPAHHYDLPVLRHFVHAGC